MNDVKEHHSLAGIRRHVEYGYSFDLTQHKRVKLSNMLIINDINANYTTATGFEGAHSYNEIW